MAVIFSKSTPCDPHPPQGVQGIEPVNARCNLKDLLQAKLSRRITLLIFLSLTLIEGILLVPSYFRRQDELTAQLEEVSAAKIATLIKIARIDTADHPELLAQAVLRNAEAVKDDPRVLGWTVLSAEGKVLTTYGEAPLIKSDDLLNNRSKGLDTKRFHRWEGNKYDVAYDVSWLKGKGLLVVRHEAGYIKEDLKLYVWRIIGLVVIIAIFLTGSTLLILANIAILPILQLQRDLEGVVDAIQPMNQIPEDTCPNQNPPPQLVEPTEFYAMSHSSLHRGDELGELMQAFREMYLRVRQEITDRYRAEQTIAEEKAISEKLLLNLLPEVIADRLKQGEKVIADGFSEVTVLFADIVNFTELASQIAPVDLVCLLNQIFSGFDGLADQYGLEKIKTIGDAYMVVGGLPCHRDDHAIAVAHMALSMQRMISQINTPLGQPFALRIGIHSGPVVAGVIGIKKFIYDLWGDTVNVASRMESHGQPGAIQVSPATASHLNSKFTLELRGAIAIKGKGMMETYWLRGAVV
ncbi:MAG: adenylate/guanylate cyclase domain-containing protein [Pseudanabaenaceae cyanobacterium]|jgi:adenylate cyclase